MPSEYPPVRRAASLRERPTRSIARSTDPDARPIVSAAISSVSRPERPLWVADASSSTPTNRPGFGTSANRAPRMRASPESGRASPTSMRMVVDFPAPFGPRNPVTR